MNEDIAADMVTTGLGYDEPEGCPSCSGTALYRFGFSPAGKQKYLCLLCSRQFVANPDRVRYPNKPVCGECGSVMYLYKRSAEAVCFRCSGYPVCRNYRKEPRPQQ